MLTRKTAACCILALAALGSPLSNAQIQPIGTEFAYQGTLQFGGAPLNDDADFRFSLWSEATGGSQSTAPIELLAVPVLNGVFNVQLDFGSGPFVSGYAYWLEIEVRSPAGSGAYTLLNQRQRISVTPTAIYAQQAEAVIGIDGHSLDSYDGSFQDAVFVQNSGNVGIGTLNPMALLDVAGPPGSDFRIGRDLSNNPIMSTDNQGNLNLRPRWNGLGSVVVRNDFDDAGIQMSTNINTIEGGRLNEIRSVDGSGGAYPLTLNAFGGDVRLAPGGNGKVGIGTYTPEGSLQINKPGDAAAFKHGSDATGPHHLVSNRDMVFNAFDADGASNGSPLFWFRRNGTSFDEGSFTDLMTITDGGSVGVGTSSPSSKLTVNGAIESKSGGIVFPDGSVQMTAATAQPTFIVTTRTNDDQGAGVPAPYCPDGWSIVDSWTYKMPYEESCGSSCKMDVRQTLCSYVP